MARYLPDWKGESNAGFGKRPRSELEVAWPKRQHLHLLFTTVTERQGVQ